MEESCTSISFHLFILLDMGDVASDSDWMDNEISSRDLLVQQYIL
jgi:hypothetical protein